MPTCPLCQADRSAPFHNDRRDYFRCRVCRLVFVPSRQFLSRDDEKTHYDLHENSPEDVRYRAFLNRLFQPVNERLPPRSLGLDFGSGPGPTLSVMFQEAGHSMVLFDPVYAPGEAALQQQYDFITASEVVEHLHHPRRELDRLWNCLKPGGLLGVMTKRVRDREAFASWHYKQDPTHVCFFSIPTFQWLAEHWRATLTVVGEDVVLFDKP